MLTVPCLALRFCLAAIKETVGGVAATGASHGNDLVAEVATMPRGVRRTQRYRYLETTLQTKKQGEEETRQEMYRCSTLWLTLESSE